MVVHGLDEIHEESESDSSEFESSRGTDIDLDYNPDPSGTSSSEVEIWSPDTGSSCDKLYIAEDVESPDTNLSEEDDQQRGESSTSNSVSVREKQKKQGRELDEDGCSDHFSPPKKQHSEDRTLDLNDEISTTTSISVQERQKKRRRKLVKAVADSSSSEERATPNPKTQKQTKNAKKSPGMKRPWSEVETRAVDKHLGRFMAERRVPRKADCMICVKAEKSLAQRSWKDVKNFVYNRIVTLNRRAAKRILQF
ncbi:uncharacterized protein LOC131343785 isoform X2 [Hemibagrus wyckioides]|uniref:uncharacterized protein LOC131342774 isoform X2 n=1 Tax=Hemibagrus wyckioides TaxID=337641 RepID=UPI00266CE5A3|nr:uncharacterized protein LOC131342774 isoform X2 [Hemibagrus wyckioides]XP_058231699.1 uncharacterized protein LOC131343785 isoform X2 [Hemibagrus wyckioides]